MPGFSAVGYYFGRFELALSTKHVVDGATYTDIHAELPAKAELIKVSAVCGTTCEQYQDLSKAIAGTPDEN